MPLDEFADKYGRADGEPEYATTRDSPWTADTNAVQPFKAQLLRPSRRRDARKVHPGNYQEGP